MRRGTVGGRPCCFESSGCIGRSGTGRDISTWDVASGDSRLAYAVDLTARKGLVLTALGGYKQVSIRDCYPRNINSMASDNAKS